MAYAIPTNSETGSVDGANSVVLTDVTEDVTDIYRKEAMDWVLIRTVLTN